ncbi:hypothetical protein GOBAR_AA27033 [Gossypium barbadense]|uniref:Uncharacterized protein n=1 Tax=Gossypium barbadense TaxID=3634 RepID=A0A2P5WRB4_GOSBA|nr:hypothetical protein GOBAR_AA27033 [Gossypium barbadense]
MVLQVNEDVVASSAELAKAYMGSRTPKESVSRPGLQNQVPRGDLTCSSNKSFPSMSSTMSAIYSMARTPYSRVNSSTLLKSSGTASDAFGGSSSSSQSAWEQKRISGSTQGTPEAAMTFSVATSISAGSKFKFGASADGSTFNNGSCASSPFSFSSLEPSLVPSNCQSSSSATATKNDSSAATITSASATANASNSFTSSLSVEASIPSFTGEPVFKFSSSGDPSTSVSTLSATSGEATESKTQDTKTWQCSGTGSSIFAAKAAVTITGSNIFGFSAPATSTSASQSQGLNPFNAVNTQASATGTGIGTSTQSTPIQFSSSASSPSFGLTGNATFSSGSSIFGSSASVAKPFSSGSSFGISSSSSETNSLSSSSGIGDGAFGSTWQAPKTPTFGSSSGFSFGSSTSVSAPSPQTAEEVKRLEELLIVAVCCSHQNVIDAGTNFQHYQQLQGKQLNLRHRIQKLGNVGIFPFGSTSAFTGSGSSIFGGTSAASSSAGTTAEVASSGNSSSNGVSSTITNSGSGFFSSTFSPVTSTSNGIFGGTSVGTSTGNGIFGGTSATTSTATGLFGATPSQPVFGKTSPGLVFGSTRSSNNDQKEDSMVEDTFQASPAVVTFSQQSISPPASGFVLVHQTHRQQVLSHLEPYQAWPHHRIHLHFWLLVVLNLVVERASDWAPVVVTSLPENAAAIRKSFGTILLVDIHPRQGMSPISVPPSLKSTQGIKIFSPRHYRNCGATSGKDGFPSN